MASELHGPNVGRQQAGSQASTRQSAGAAQQRRFGGGESINHSCHSAHQPAASNQQPAPPHPRITEITRSLQASASGRLITAAAGAVGGSSAWSAAQQRCRSAADKRKPCTLHSFANSSTACSCPGPMQPSQPATQPTCPHGDAAQRAHGWRQGARVLQQQREQRRHAACNRCGMDRKVCVVCCPAQNG